MKETPIAAIRREQKTLSVGDAVVVYVPWAIRDDDGSSMFGPYWEGKIIDVQRASFPTGLRYFIDRGRSDDDVACFHRIFVFPERLRGKVRYTGESKRLRIDA